MKRLAWHEEQLSILSWVRDVVIVKFFTLSEFRMWALTLLKGKKGWEDADGRSFIFTYLPPSLGPLRRAALTWCQQHIACCSGVHLSSFPGSLAVSSLWPFSSLSGGGCTAEKQIKCMTFVYMIYTTSFTAIEMQTDVCRRKASTEVQYRFVCQKAWPKNRDR